MSFDDIAYGWQVYNTRKAQERYYQDVLAERTQLQALRFTPAQQQAFDQRVETIQFRLRGLQLRRARYKRDWLTRLLEQF